MSVLRDVLLDVYEGELPDGALYQAALLVRRAGLEHLVDVATGPEVVALAEAGDALARERAALLVACAGDPARAVSPYDGGGALRAQAMAWAWGRAGWA